MRIPSRYRLVLSLLLGTLLLSVGLNFYCLLQLEAPPGTWTPDETSLAETELELALARAELAACQRSAHLSLYPSDTILRARTRL